MLRVPGVWEGVAVGAYGLVLAVAVANAIMGFALDVSIILVLSVAVLLGSIFGERRDTWSTDRQFSSARVFFRTFEWLSLAVAGYIILSVIGTNTDTAT
jgi:hypothetical protein